MPKQQSGNPAKRAARQPNRQHQHGEAYHLMKYRADHRQLEEIIYNSRDGVTPFVITMRDGTPGTHVDWRGDVYAPDHQPAVGERIFIDLTEGRAREIATEQADKLWAGPVDTELSYHPRAVYGSHEALRNSLLTGLLDEVQRGAPDIVEVTAEYAEARGWPVEERDAGRLQRVLDLQRALGPS